MLSTSDRILTLEPFGLNVSLTEDKTRLSVTPADRITPEARAYIQTHKDVLRAQLLTFQSVSDITAGIVTAVATSQPLPNQPLPADLMERVNLITTLEDWPEAGKQEWITILQGQLDRKEATAAELVQCLDAHLKRWHDTREQDTEAFEERAAILEYEAGLPRAEAECIASQDNDCMSCQHWQGVHVYADGRSQARKAVGMHAQPQSRIKGVCACHYRPWRLSNVASTANYYRWHWIGQCAYMPVSSI